MIHEPVEVPVAPTIVNVSFTKPYSFFPTVPASKLFTIFCSYEGKHDNLTKQFDDPPSNNARNLHF